MTADELQQLVIGLSSFGWTRHWLHWNHSWTPGRSRWVMAVQVLRSVRDPYSGLDKLTPIRIADLEDRGFRVAPGEDYIYTIERTNPDGSPYGADRAATGERAEKIADRADAGSRNGE